VNELDQRAPRVRESAYLGWIAHLPCIACMVDGTHNTAVHAAHVRFADFDAGWRSVGMQEKPDDRRCLPLCPPHHTGDARRVRITQHAMNEREFYEAIHVDATALCAALSDAFDAGRSGHAVIARFAAKARREKFA
jgi:hypothetical protein